MKKSLFIVCIFVCVNPMFAQPSISSFSPTSARAYTGVTIIGSNLSGATAVRFGGTPASFFFVQSATQILAFVANGSSGDISVTTPVGTASVGGFIFLPAPSINTFNPESGGSGSAVVISGEHFTGTSNVYFGGTPAFSFTVTSDTSITAVVSNGSSGSISITTPNGQGVKTGFTYTGPVITKFEPTAGGTGTVVDITGLNFSTATAVTFGANAAASFTVNSSTSITAIVGTLDSSGSISITSPAGTSTVLGFNTPSIASFIPTQGSKDSVVTIKGHNFSGTSQVQFGGTNAASFDVLSDSLLTARLGYGSTGAVSIKNAFGTGSKQTFSYNYPAPVITSFSPTSGFSGAAITIKGAGFFSASAVQIGVSAANSFTVVSDSLITAVTDNSASGSVSVYTRGGFTSLPGFVYTGPVINSFAPMTAITGTPIIISGKNLLAITGVSFGGTPAASFTINSATTITAIVGGGTSGDVILISPFGDAKAYGFKMVPVISSFTPAVGGVGTIVTINGNNFNIVPVNNIVYFGAVKARVTSATITQLVVEVPSGATYEPISVTVNYLSGYSAQPFIVTSATVSTGFTTNSFAPKLTYPVLYQGAGNYGVIRSAIGDIDGDGRIDFIILKNLPPSDNTSFSIFRNKTRDSIVDFEAPVHFAPYIAGCYGMALHDMDGDGKSDVIISREGGGTSKVSIFKNTSTEGNFSFAARADYSVGTYVGDVVVSDLDGDGKPDMIIPNGNASNKVSIFKNTSSYGSLSFQEKVDYVTGSLPYEAAIKDLNGDGKPDLAVANSSGNTVSVFKNTSSIGIIAFDAKTDYVIATGLGHIKIADLNNDNKPDLMVTNSLNNSLSILQNTSSPNTVSFNPKIDFTTGLGPYGLDVADLDGDGKPDIAVANNDQSTVSVFKNTSSGSAISLASRVNFAAGNQPRNISIADFNGDGKPDLLTPNWVSYDGSLLLNRIGMPIPLLLCPSVANTQILSAVSGTVYQWQVNQNNRNGFSNIIDDSFYIGSATSVLHINAVTSFQTDYQYRCLIDGKISDVFQLKFVDRWTGAINSSWENPGNWSCGKVPDNNTDVIVNSGTLVLGSNTAIKSIKITQGATLTILSGYTLTLNN